MIKNLNSFLIGLCLSIITWVYTTDRNDFKTDIKSIAVNVQEISTQQKLNGAYNINTSRRLEKVEETQLKFIRKQMKYWGEK